MTAGGISLALFYNPQKNWKEWENFINENTLQEAKKRNKAFWMLRDGALKADSYMKMCKEVFDF